MSKGGIIRCVLSLLMVAYLIVALSFTTKRAGMDICRSLTINIVDSTSRNFVTHADIADEIAAVYPNITYMTHDSINTLLIEKHIMSKDNIESANCVILNNGSVKVDVTPLIPVARVFDKQGGSYYINRAGKHMLATTKYRSDVPIITGAFGARLSPTIVFPLLEYMEKHPEIEHFTSAIEVKPNGDMILIPTVKGHVVNLGDCKDIANKFDRLKVFYHKVMPVKGWEYYDTISVKWRGQIVAKQRNHRPERPTIPIEEHSDIDDIGTMLPTQVQ